MSDKEEKDALKKAKEASKKEINEFKEFALKGNIVDMAVGVIIGGAFGTIVSSLVSDIVMPLISRVTGNIDFTNKFMVLGSESGDAVYATLEEAQAAGANTLNYGLFITNIINFIIIAIAMFIIIKKVFGALKKSEETTPPDPTTKKCPYCLSEIPIKATKCPHCTSDLKE